MSHRGSILALPSGVLAWTPRIRRRLDGSGIRTSSAGRGRIRLLLVGTGIDVVFLPEPLRRMLREAGIGVDVMQTGAAARTYNILLDEGRQVAAALHRRRLTASHEHVGQQRSSNHVRRNRLEHRSRAATRRSLCGGNSPAGRPGSLPRLDLRARPASAGALASTRSAPRWRGSARSSPIRFRAKCAANGGATPSRTKRGAMCGQPSRGAARRHPALPPAA